MHLWIHRVCQYLQTIHQTRTWAVEIRGAVRHIDLASADSWQVRPARDGSQLRDVVHRAVHSETAAGDKDDLRLPGDDFFPAESPRGLAFLAESLDAAGQADQFGIPVATGERR